MAVEIAYKISLTSPEVAARLNYRFPNADIVALGENYVGVFTDREVQAARKLPGVIRIMPYPAAPEM